MSIPDFLPDLLNLNGEHNEIIEYLYSIFRRDFIECITEYNLLPVKYDSNILPNGQGKEEGFWHLITKENKIIGGRFFDNHRARHLHWIKLLLVNSEREGIYTFKYDYGNSAKGIRTFIWLKNYGYVIVMREFRRSCMIITAYPIEYDNYRKDIQRMYDNRLE